MKQEIQNEILRLLEQRGTEKSICPSEVSRNLFPEDWRERMEEVRSVAKNMKQVMLTQGGSEVRDDYKGPIRIKLKPD